MKVLARSLGGMGAPSRNSRNFRNTDAWFFNGAGQHAPLSPGAAEPRDHGLERRTSLEWGHGGHRYWPLLFEK